MERTYKVRIFRPALGSSSAYIGVVNDYTGAKPLKPILPDLTPEEEEKLKQGLPITRIEYV